jgi:hypothetical protein
MSPRGGGLGAQRRGETEADDVGRDEPGVIGGKPGDDLGDIVRGGDMDVVGAFAYERADFVGDPAGVG